MEMQAACYCSPPVIVEVEVGEVGSVISAEGGEELEGGESKDGHKQGNEWAEGFLAHLSVNAIHWQRKCDDET